MTLLFHFSPTCEQQRVNLWQQTLVVVRVGNDMALVFFFFLSKTIYSRSFPFPFLVCEIYGLLVVLIPDCCCVDETYISGP